MLRTGLGFFKFTPRHDERPEVWFQRFGSMLEEANAVAGLGLNVTFQSWMLLSLFQLAPRKWADVLKDLCHRLPHDRGEQLTLQRATLRERMLEGSVFDLRGAEIAYLAAVVVTAWQSAKQSLGHCSCA